MGDAANNDPRTNPNDPAFGGKKGRKKRARLKSDSLEERILLSATWVDADAETIEGGNGADDMDGSDLGETLDGGNGADDLFGGGGDDRLIGGNGADTMEGGEGDDTIVGGRGNDTAVFSGNADQYSVTQNDDGSYTVADSVGGRDGTDELQEVETLRFADGEFAIAEAVGPATAGAEAGAEAGAGAGTSAGAGDSLASEDFSGGVDGWGDEVASDNGRMFIGQDGTAGKTFDFGGEHAGQTVVVEFDLETEGTWDTSGSYADSFNVVVNGETVASETYSGDGKTAHFQLEVQADENGRVAVELNPDSTGADEGVFIDNFEITAGDDWSGSGGPLSFDVGDAADGDVFTFAGGDSTDTIDLSAFDSSAATFADGSMTVSLEDGGSFRIDYENIEQISFADVSATVIDGDAEGSTSATEMYIDGASAFSIGVEGDGGVDWTYDADSGTLTVTDNDGTNADSVLHIGDFGDSDVTIDNITLDTNIGGVSSEADLQAVTITSNADVDSITVGGGQGSIGSIEFTGNNVNGSPMTINADVGSFDAHDVNTSITVNGDVDSVSIGDDLANDATFHVTGDVGTFSVADNVQGGADIRVDGDAGTIDINGSFSSGSTLTVGGAAGSLEFAEGMGGDVGVTGNADSISVNNTASGSITVGGDLGSMTAQKVTGDVSVTGDVTSITTSGDDADFRGSLSVGGNLASMTAGDDIEGSITVGGDVGTISASDDIKNSGSITVAGNADSITAGDKISKAIDVGGNLTQLNAGYVTGAVSVDGDLTTVTVSGNVSGSGMTVGGDLQSYTVGGTVNTPIDVAGDIDSMSATKFTGGSISVGGSVESITTSGNDADFRAELEIQGDLGTMDVGDDIERPVTVHGNVDSITAGDDFKSQGSLTVHGSLGSLSAGDQITTAISVDGEVGSITAGTFSGSGSFGGNVQSLDFGGSVSGGGISIAGDLGTFDADGSVNTTLSVTGSATSIEAGKVTGGSITVNGDLGSFSTTANDGDLRGSLTVGGSVGTIDIDDDIEKPVTVGGDVGSITVGDDTKNNGTISVAGSVGSITIEDMGRNDISVGGDLGSLTTGTNFLGIMQAGSVDGEFSIEDGSFSFSDTLASQGVTYDGATNTVTVEAPPDASAEDASLSVADATGSEDSEIALSISAGLTDTDGSETLSVTISGVPTGALLSAGTDNGDGSWTVNPEQLDGLSVTPPPNSHEDFTLTVEATTTEASTGDTATVASSLSVTVDGVVDGPSLTTADASGSEDEPIALAISADAVGGDSVTQVTIGNVPDGATLSAGTDNGDGTWTVEPDQLDGLTITPPQDFSGEFDLSVSATSGEASVDSINFNDHDITSYGGSSQDKTGTVSVEDGGSTFHMEGNTWKDIDFPYTITEDTILEFEFRAEGDAEINGIGFDTNEGIGQGSTFKLDGSQNWGTDAGQSYSGDGEWQTFQIRVGDHMSGDVSTMTFTHDHDVSNPDSESWFRNVKVYEEGAVSESASGETATTEGNIHVTISGVADAPSLDVADASGAEDGVIPLTIDAGLTDNSEVLSVTVSGVPDGASLSAGTDNGDGSWTLNADQLDGLTVSPAENSAEDFQLTVTATSVDGASVAEVSETINVDVEAVADQATLTTSDASGSEDSAIPLSVSASLNDNDGSETLSVTVSGVPDGASLSAGTDNGDGSWTLTADQLEGLSVTPPQNFSGSFELEVTARSVDGSDVATTSDTIDVSVSGVADAPSLDVADASGAEDGVIPLTIDAGLTDNSEVLSVTVSGVPDGASLSAGTDNGDGSWTLNADQLDGLTVSPAENSAEDFQLTVTATSVDGASVAEVSETINVDVEAVADQATLTTSDASGSEDSAIPLSVSASLNDNDGSETLSVTVSGAPIGAVFSDGDTTVVADSAEALDLTGMDLSSLTVTPGANSDADFTLKFGATSTESSGDAATMFAEVNVRVDDVADAPTLGVAHAAGVEDTPVGLDISSTLTDTDGSETLSVTVSGIPDGASLSTGNDNGDGSWTLTADQLDGLELSPPADFAGEIDLLVTATSTDTSGDSAERSATMTATFEGRADAAALGATDAAGWEDSAIPLQITASVSDSSETLDVVVAGVPDGAVLSAGTDNGDGSWTLTPSQLDGLTMTPPPDFSGSFELEVIARTYDMSDASEVTTEVNVSVDGVADGATLSAADASGFEDTPVPLAIDAVIGDASETMDITVAGVPAGASLSAGVDNGDGTWTLVAGDLPGLSLTPAPDASGSFDLMVTATTTDGDSSTETQANMRVDIRGVADAAKLSTTDSSGVEDSPVPLSIDASLADSSEDMVVRVTGVPDGASLTQGSPVGEGVWELSPAEASAVEFVPPADASGSFELGVEAVTSDGTTEAVSTASLTVNVEGRADTPTLEALNVNGLEDSPIDLDVTSSRTDTDGSETLRVTVTGVPDGASLSAGSDNGDGTWTLEPGQLEALQFNPPEHFSGTVQLVATSVSQESDGHFATASAAFQIEVAAVTDGPTLGVEAPDAVDQGSGFELNIDTATADADGSERISVTVAGVPGNVSLSAGINNGDGTWTLTPDQLDGLSVQPGPDFVGTLELSITSSASDGDADAVSVTETVRIAVEGLPIERGDSQPRSGPSEIDWSGEERLAVLDPTQGTDQMFDRIESSLEEAVEHGLIDGQTDPLRDMGLSVTEEILGGDARTPLDLNTSDDSHAIFEFEEQVISPEQIEARAQQHGEVSQRGFDAGERDGDEQGPRDVAQGGFFASLWGLVRGLGAPGKRDGEDEGRGRR